MLIKKTTSLQCDVAKLQKAITNLDKDTGTIFIRCAVLRGGPREAQNMLQNTRCATPGSTGAEAPTLPGLVHIVFATYSEPREGLLRAPGETPNTA
jgi:hypothetical protein